MVLKILTVCLLLGCMLVGCGSSADVLVVYGRSGGFVGLDEQLVIDNSGQATLTRRTEETLFQVDSESLDQLRQALADASFSQLDKTYLPEVQGADRIEYSISYDGHTVRTMDGAVPEEVQPIISILNQIIEENGSP